ncbi:hypothetical protein SAMN05216511_0753 [Streptomyces sp. KS_16]|nr:hypothetical protein BX261_6498 [Streptomyces sp. 2321.6]SDQ85197.1 hypothetical protein SAMN05216511_0753 [Streptomyces sp. KS_16]SED97797.1 hypothetical protein SAMN05428940_6524 [Streptomyces sp. 2133.1]SNC73325.1 hypothetical protein SAMN06272741_6427 [Streptomyces sp. 2114.4]
MSSPQRSADVTSRLRPTASAPLFSCAARSVATLAAAGDHETRSFAGERPLNGPLDVLAANSPADALYSPFDPADILARITFLDPAGAHFSGPGPGPVPGGPGHRRQPAPRAGLRPGPPAAVRTDPYPHRAQRGVHPLLERPPCAARPRMPSTSSTRRPDPHLPSLRRTRHARPAARHPPRRTGQPQSPGPGPPRLPPCHPAPGIGQRDPTPWAWRAGTTHTRAAALSDFRRTCNHHRRKQPTRPSACRCLLPPNL